MSPINQPAVYRGMGDSGVAIPSTSPVYIAGFRTLSSHSDSRSHRLLKEWGKQSSFYLDEADVEQHMQI